MANQALAVLEDALRARKLDRTLTSAIPPGRGDGQVAPAALTELDASLQGGLPRGQLSELVGSPSSGRTTLLLQVLAAATRRGEIVALVDTFDRLDLASVVAAGVDLDRLLWIRGHAISRAQGPGFGAGFESRASGAEALGRHAALAARSAARNTGEQPRGSAGISRGGGSPWLLDRTIERALKALNLVLQAGGFGVVALDLADASPAALHRLPFTTWLRVQRTIEGSETACVLVASQPLGRSAHGLTLALDSRTQWAGQPTSTGTEGPGAAAPRADVAIATASVSASRVGARGTSSRSDRLAGLDVTVRVVSPRRRVDGDVMIAATVSQ
jgi:recombination protein RecA